MSIKTLWFCIGMLGQIMFSMRFIVQWIASEKIKKTIIPNAFWYFSLFGGVTLFTYACYKRDIVFILGQGIGVIIYTRNLYFILQTSYKKKI